MAHSLKMLALGALQPTTDTTTYLQHTNIVTLEDVIATKTMNISLIKKFRKQLDWNTISLTYPLVPEFVDAFKKYINWALVRKNMALPLDTLVALNDLIDWEFVFARYKLPMDFITRHVDIDRWNKSIVMYQKLGEQFMRDNWHRLPIYDICIHQKLSEAFILKFQDDLDWRQITYCQESLGEGLLLTMAKKVKFGWLALLAFHKFSQTMLEDILELTRNYAPADRAKVWENIAMFQILDEDFIRTYSDHLPWRILARSQSLSVPLIEEYREHINMQVLSANQNNDISILRHFRDELDWALVSKCPLTEAIIDEFRDVVHWQIIADKQILSKQFIVAHFVQLQAHMPAIMAQRSIDEDFIREHARSLPLTILPKLKPLSQKFMIDFQDQLDWKLVFQYQQLDVAFIKQVQHHITTPVHELIIAQYQTLPETFLKPFVTKPYTWYYVCFYQTLSESFMQQLIDQNIFTTRHGHIIAYRQIISERFIYKNYSIFTWFTEEYPALPNISLTFQKAMQTMLYDPATHTPRATDFTSSINMCERPPIRAYPFEILNVDREDGFD